MDHWNVAENTVSRALLDAAIDFDFNDEILFQSYYMETAPTEPDYGYDLRRYLPIFGSNHMNLESSDALYQEEMDYSLDNPHVEYTEIDEHVQISSSLVPSESFELDDGQWDGKWSIESPDGETQEEGSQETVASPVKESSPFESSWTPGMMMETGNSDEYVCLSWGYMKEEPEEELKVTAYWEKNELNYCQVSSDIGLVEVNSEVKYDIQGNGSSISARRRTLGVRKPGEKRQTKPEKVISLEVLRQHFARSLKDAAKIMGVCPTTLKRICRQHGITRWPSRKIKKVNHSLKKLQLVVDSVEGAEGFIQIGSLYSTYPELSSPDLPKNSSFSSDEFFDIQKDVKPHPKFVSKRHKCDDSKSVSSCSSQLSDSSFSYSIENKQPATAIFGLSTDHSSELEEPAKILIKSSDEADLPLLKHEDNLHLPFSLSHKARDDQPHHQGTKILPPIPEDGGAFKVKATFGESNIRFTLQPQWKFKDLQQEIARRFIIGDFSGILLKYIDSDLESVLLTCDEDLEECKELFKSSSCHIIKMSLHQSPISLTSSCTTTCLV